MNASVALGCGRTLALLGGSALALLVASCERIQAQTLEPISPLDEGERDRWLDRVARETGILELDVEEEKVEGIWIKARMVHGEAAPGKYLGVGVLTNLPAGTRLHLSIAYGESRLGWTEARVEEGRAVFCLGPYEGAHPFLAGDYRATIAYFPQRQPRSLLASSLASIRPARTEASVFVGTKEEYDREDQEIRSLVAAALGRIRTLEAERREAVRLALCGERYSIGSVEPTLDVGAWSASASLHESQVGETAEEYHRSQEDTVLAPRHPEAGRLLRELVEVELALSHAYSRRVYEASGRAPRPEDLTDHDSLSLPVLEAKARELRRQIEEFPW